MTLSDVNNPMRDPRGMLYVLIVRAAVERSRDAGSVSHFANTTGGGSLVAPFSPTCIFSPGHACVNDSYQA